MQEEQKKKQHKMENEGSYNIYSPQKQPIYHSLPSLGFWPDLAKHLVAQPLGKPSCKWCLSHTATPKSSIFVWDFPFKTIQLWGNFPNKEHPKSSIFIGIFHNFMGVPSTNQAFLDTSIDGNHSVSPARDFLASACGKTACGLAIFFVGSNRP